MKTDIQIAEELEAADRIRARGYTWHLCPKCLPGYQGRCLTCQGSGGFWQPPPTPSPAKQEEKRKLELKPAEIKLLVLRWQKSGGSYLDLAEALLEFSLLKLPDVPRWILLAESLPTPHDALDMGAAGKLVPVILQDGQPSWRRWELLMPGCGVKAWHSVGDFEPPPPIRGAACGAVVLSGESKASPGFPLQGHDD